MKDCLNALLRLIALDHLPRTGWIQHGVLQPESIAGHALGTVHLALALAPRVDPALDVDRVAALCALHDSPEAQTGDLPRPASQALPAGAKREMEAAAADTLLTPLSPTARARFEEYEASETREARLAHLCDGLQLAIRLLAYREAGQGGLDDFMPGVQALDCSEFPPAEELHRAILARLHAKGGQNSPPR